MFRRSLFAIVLAAASIALIALLTACGDDDSDEAAAAETDGAFIAEMTAHHESAIEMAEIAEGRAQHPEIQRLAGAIIAAQNQEIDQLEGIHQRLFDEPVTEADHGTLGLAEHEAGMEGDAQELETAKPFDRAFIDMMVPHHQGAIRMARIELERGEDPELHDLAQLIINAQSGEIAQMNQLREQWYGAPSPAGGVPPEDEGAEAPSHEEMGH